MFDDRRGPAVIETTWPGAAADLALDLATDPGGGYPLLRVKVTTPRDQSVLHRKLARAGYVPTLSGTLDNGTEVWDFYHPDGEKRT